MAEESDTAAADDGAGKEREIEVRTLSGESSRVRVSGEKTVNELKRLLSLAFPPASPSSSPNFHLFFKGVKLSLQSKLSSISIESGEFLVLVPFVKKDRPQTPKPVFDTNEPKKTPISSLADSTHSDLMREFSFLSEKSSHGTEQPSSETIDAFSGYKRKRDSYDHEDCSKDNGKPYSFFQHVIQSSSMDITEEKNCEKFVEVLESLNCLKNPHSQECAFLASASGSDMGVHRGRNRSCFCPPWLKRIMEAFAFLNIFSAFRQIQKEDIVSVHLKEVLKQLQKCGSKVEFEHIEHLSVLCPKVVTFSDNDTKPTNSGGALIIIINSERVESQRNVRKGKKSMLSTRIHAAMRRRESSFRKNVWDATKCLLYKNRNADCPLFSMEALVKIVKEGGHVESGKDAKWAKRSQSSFSRFRCRGTNELSPADMVQHLRKGIGSKGQLVHVEEIGARKPSYVDIPDELSDDTKSTLKGMGINKLYCHQADSIRASLAGKNVAVATMTSSGKSICYNVPVLEILSKNLSSCALYLFPTKALAQDQLRVLSAMTKGFCTGINIGVYDGDTSQTERLWLRDNARVLITNPDMLHVSILPSHRQFSRILSNLRFVVIDEAHTYKGAFGCHTALILRRLFRLCSHAYGSNPSSIFCTATSANPREHCTELANLSTMELIEIDGSPSSQKLFALWNPISSFGSVSNVSDSGIDNGKHAEKGLSPISEVSYLFAEMVQHGLRCIAFCRSRKLTELVLSYTREILQDTAPHLVDSICAYRGGYVAEDRRKIEGDFFTGKLCGIAATNALELGIDVGHIDATLHLGFPGSIASLWQQAGRSGRRQRPSLAVYVAFEGPLDQYFMKFPKKLFSSPIECCHIDAQNQQVLEQHLVCAALEYPLSLVYDEKYFGSGLNAAVRSLAKKLELSCDPARSSSARVWSYIGLEKMPSRGISIRAMETIRYRVIDMQLNEVLEEIEESRAFFQVYEGAVYMHQGRTYLVKELDVSEKIALCHKADFDYYTKTRDYTDIHVLGGDLAYPPQMPRKPSLKTTAQVNYCTVTTTWFGFYSIQKGSKKVIDSFDLSLPKYSYESQAVWVRVPQIIKNLVEEKSFSFRGGLHAASHAILNVVPLYIRCDSSDVAPECSNPHDSRSYPERILVYDHRPGGNGVSVQIRPYFAELLNSALELVRCCRCPGVTGCPNCVQSLVCHEYNEDIQKEAAIMIIEGVLDSEKSAFQEDRGSPKR